MSLGVAQFLSPSDLNRFQLVCRHWWVDLNTHEALLRRITASSSIPPAVRPRLWLRLLAGERPFLFDSRETYHAAAARLSENEDLISEISKDATRTLNQHPRFGNAGAHGMSEGQASLTRALGVALHQRTHSYVQGMNYIAAIFLLVFDGDEWITCECFHHFLFGHPLHRNDNGTGVGFAWNGIEAFDEDFKIAKEISSGLQDFVHRACPRLSLLVRARPAEFQIPIITFSWVLLHHSYALALYDPDVEHIILSIWDQVLLRGVRATIGVSRLLLGDFERSKICRALTPSNVHTIDICPFLIHLRDHPKRFFRANSHRTKTILALADKCSNLAVEPPTARVKAWWTRLVTSNLVQRKGLQQGKGVWGNA